MSTLLYDLLDDDDFEIPWDEHNPYLDDDEDKRYRLKDLNGDKWAIEEEEIDEWEEEDDFEVV
jgi:hypothetical protein